MVTVYYWWWINTQTGEKRLFPYSYEEGLPVGSPENAEGTPLWQPWRGDSEHS